MKHKIIIETELSAEKLHELLCKVIHESDLEAVAQLAEEVQDIKLSK
jgi:hypothetical protein